MFRPMGANLANALLLNLQAVDLLRHGVDVKDMKVDKYKIVREKLQNKNTKWWETQGTFKKKYFDILMYREITDENRGSSRNKRCQLKVQLLF